MLMQRGQCSGVVNVGVRNQHSIHLSWIEAQLTVAAFCIFPASLEEAAVEKDTCAVGLKQMPASRD